MPELFYDKVVVKLEELVPDYFSTYEALKKNLQRHKSKPYGIKRAQLGGNGRRLLIDFDTLPKEIQEKLGDPRIPKHKLEPHFEIKQETIDFYNNFQYPDGRYLLPETIEKHIINASVLETIIKLDQIRRNLRIRLGHSCRDVPRTLFNDAHEFNDSYLRKYKDCEHSLNKNERRFKEQLKLFRKDGLKSLIKDIKGNSRKNASKRNDMTNELLNNLFAGRRHKPTATQVAREYDAFLQGYIEIVNEETSEIYNPKDFKPLKEKTITRFLNLYESRSGTHAKRSGDRQKHMSKYMPYHSMEMPQYAGSIISIDDRQPPFWYDDKRSRMWWYIGIDIASQAIVAWAYGKTKEELIINFYRNMVSNHAKWNLPLPNELECESSLNSSFKNTFLRDGYMFQKVNIHANSARSKYIERMFGKIRYQLEKLREGWIARHTALSETNQAGPDGNRIISYDILVQQCMNDIITWNNTSREEDGEISRFDYFMQNQHKELKPTNYKAFIRDLGKSTVTSCNAGIIKLQRSEWVIGDKGKIHTGDKLINVLKQIESREIDIYWLDDEKGNVYKALVYDRIDGRYICEAISKPVAARAKIEETQKHKEAREIMSKYVNTVGSYIRKQKNKIDKITVIDKRPKTVSNSFTMDEFENKLKTKDKPGEIIGTEEQEDDVVYTPSTKKRTGALNRAFS